MTFLVMLAFSAMLVGIFFIIRMNPFEFADELVKPLTGRKKPLGKRIKEIENTKEPKGFRRTLAETREILTLTGRSNKFAALCALSLFFAIIGILLCSLMENIVMIPVMALGCAFLPFWFVIFTSHSYRKMLNNEIETGLSIITTSYLRNENIIIAVSENIDYLNPPVADVFKGFLAETGVISTDIKKSLISMKQKLKNGIFHEWIDAVIACQDDKTLKSTLTPIIAKLSDMRIVAAELDYLMYEPLKEFITMAILLVANIPLLYFLNKSWFTVLVGTGFGKGILAVCLAVLFVSFAAVVRLTKPVEYRR